MKILDTLVFQIEIEISSWLSNMSFYFKVVFPTNILIRFKLQMSTYFFKKHAFISIPVEYLEDTEPSIIIYHIKYAKRLNRV